MTGFRHFALGDNIVSLRHLMTGVVDQQHRWKSSLLPDPRPRALDPLLIGELKQGHARKFFLLEQFDLTPAEQ